MNIDVQKIKKKISKIKDVIKTQGKYGYYLIDNDKVKLVSKGQTKLIAKNDFLKKIKGKERFIDSTVYEVSININEKYITKSSSLIAGPVSLVIKEFIITKKYKLSYEADFKFGSVWYTNDDIGKGEFHFNDIKKIIKNIHDKNINIIGIGKISAIKLKN